MIRLVIRKLQIFPATPQQAPYRRRNTLFAVVVCCWLTLESGAAAAPVTWRRVGTVTTLTNGQLCKTDGNDVICDTTTPTISSGLVGIGTTNPATLLHVNGVETVGLNGGTGGQITFNGATSGSVALSVAAAAGSGTVFQLPATNGTNTYVLQTDGSGVTSWVAGASSFTGLTTGDLCTATSGTALACASTLSGDVTSAGGTATVTTVAKIQGTTVSGTTGSTNVVFSASPTLTGTIAGAAETLSSTIVVTGLATFNGGLSATTGAFSGAITDTQAPTANTSIDGLILTDTTVASSGNQQYSPRVHFTGQGWKTTATAASQSVDMIEELQPVQGTTNPSGNLVWSDSINGGAYGALMTLTSGGNVGIGTTSPGTLLTVAGPISLEEPTTPACTSNAYTVAATDSSLTFDDTSATCTVTMPLATSYPGRVLLVSNEAAETVVSTSTANEEVIPQGSTTAGTAILPATVGAWAVLQSNGANWVEMSSGSGSGLTWPLAGAADTAAAPDYAWAAGTTTGLYYNTGIGFTVAGTSVGTVTSTGLNSMAIGATTASTGAFTTVAASGAITDTRAPAANTSIDGVTLTDTTVASSGNQQYSPRVHFTGQGWKTTATAASQSVDMIEELQPMQGAANPSGNLVWSSSINGGAYGALMTLTTGGTLTVSSANSANSANAGYFVLTGSANGTALEGIDNTGGGGSGVGVYGVSTQNNGTGVWGVAGSGSASAPIGVLGDFSGTGAGAGVYGYTNQNNNVVYGVYGINAPGTNSATNWGGYFTDNSTGVGVGVLGAETGASNTGYAVQAVNSSTTGWGIYSSGTSPNYFAGNVGIGTTNPATLLHVNGVETVGLNGGTGGQITFNGATSGSVALSVAAAAGSGTVFQLPATNGTNSYVLQTNGSGVTSWVAGASSFTGLTTGDLCTATSGTALACASTLSGDVTSASGTATVTTVAAIQGTTVSGTTGTTNVVFSASPTLTGTITAAAATFSGAVTMSPASANIAISPTGTGTVTISPAGALTINPTAASTINNTSIGATTASTGAFTTAAASAAITDTRAPAANTSIDGLILTDTTVASSGNQQYSPRVHFTGQGWKTTATAASQSVDMIEELQPVQGAANPSGNLVWSSSINGGAYGTLMTLTTGGNVGIGTTTPAMSLDLSANSDGLKLQTIAAAAGASCTSTYQGAIRYNSTGNTIEFCNGSNWVLVAVTSSSCGAPSGLSFTNVTSQALSTSVASNTATITFSGCGGGSEAVSVSGAATAQISINGGAWVTSGSISSGQTLQVRMTTSGSVSTVLTATVTVGGSSTNWTTTTRAGSLKVFLTPGSYVGSAIGGLSGADALCQSAAGTAGYAGTYKAIMSDDSTSAASRLTLSYPIVNAYNASTVAAVNLWNGTWSTNVLNPSGAEPFDAPIWTGSSVVGAIKTGETCSSWTGGTNGEAGDQDRSAWLDYTASACSGAHPFYCIQQ
jgi:hypothetical protein